MKTYIAQRLGIGFLTLLGMSIVIFGMLRLAPGDIVDILFSTGGYVNPAARTAIEKELGLDRPVWVQYVEWIRQIVTGDLGKSYRYDLPAWEIIRPLIPVTVELAVLSLIVSVVLGVPFGVISAVRQDTGLDYALRVFSLAGLSMPSFWLGMVIILSLVAWFGWIPPVTYVSPRENFLLHCVQFALPSLAVGYRSSALIMRITRSSRSSDARGLHPHRTAEPSPAASRHPAHALKNAILPVVGPGSGRLAGSGGVGPKVVFSCGLALPGGAIHRDYPTCRTAMFTRRGDPLGPSDMLSGFLDPRVRYGH